jgi:glutamyl-tRNA synthetase
MIVRGRYAPSPTGALHLGNARTALLAYLQARSHRGAFVMRVEDLDRAREVPGASRTMLDDLRWLGLDWDEGPDEGGPVGPYVQSARGAIYEAALLDLGRAGLVYECFCSRGEIAAASAPRGPADDGPRYPGTCRELAPEERSRRRASGRTPSLRFRVPEGAVSFDDGLCGRVDHDVSAVVGDFVVKRADGAYAYQLAAAVDDARMGMTHVLRGDDLLLSTPRQILIQNALGLRAPRYFHVPLLLSPDGRKLAKRNGDETLSALRARGVSPGRLISALARSCGFASPLEAHPRELVASFDLAAVRRGAGAMSLEGID